jgi:hypothetical protein
MQKNVAAHFNDGKTAKGTSLDALSGNPQCHIGTKDDGVVEVLYRDLKALSFVKELDGDHEYRDVQEPEVWRRTPAREQADPHSISRWRGDGRIVECVPTDQVFFLHDANRQE